MEKVGTFEYFMRASFVIALVAVASESRADILGDLVGSAIGAGAKLATNKLDRNDREEVTENTDSLSSDENSVLSVKKPVAASFTYTKSGEKPCTPAAISSHAKLAELLSKKSLQKWGPKTIRFVLSLNEPYDTSFLLAREDAVKMIVENEMAFEGVRVVIGGYFNAFEFSRKDCTWIVLEDPRNFLYGEWMAITRAELIRLVDESLQYEAALNWPLERELGGKNLKSDPEAYERYIGGSFRAAHLAYVGPRKDREAAMEGRGAWEKLPMAGRRLSRYFGVWVSAEERKCDDLALKLGEDGRFIFQFEKNQVNRGRYASFEDSKGVHFIFENDAPISQREGVLKESDGTCDFGDFFSVGCLMKMQRD